MAAPLLTTARLQLRPVRPADVDALHVILNDSSVRRYLCDDAPMPRGFAEQLVAESNSFLEAYNVGLWLMYEGASAEAVGFCSLKPESDRFRAELLYALLPRRWGSGLAVEAARAVIGHAFALGFEEIVAEMDEPNTKSSAVAEKLGMVFSGTRPGPVHRLRRYTLKKPR